MKGSDSGLLRSGCFGGRTPRRFVTYVVITILLCPGRLLAQSNDYVPNTHPPGVTIEGSEVHLAPARELLAIFVSTSDCAGNRHEGLDDAVRTMKNALNARADSLGYSFDAIGVALDEDISAGLDYLLEGKSRFGTKEFGPWAEVTAGRGFVNIASSYLILEEGDRTVPVPQVIVVERTVIPHVMYAETTRPRRVLRVTGEEDLVEWGEKGFPIQDLTEEPLEATRRLR